MANEGLYNKPGSLSIVCHCENEFSDIAPAQPLPSGCSAISEKHVHATLRINNTLYIGYTAIGYGTKSVKGWVIGCPDLPAVN